MNTHDNRRNEISVEAANMAAFTAKVGNIFGFDAEEDEGRCICGRMFVLLDQNRCYLCKLELESKQTELFPK